MFSALAGVTEERSKRGKQFGQLRQAYTQCAGDTMKYHVAPPGY